VAQSHGAIEVVDLANERIEVVKMELGEHVRVLHKTLSNLPLPSQVLVGAVVREGELFVPGGADVLLPGDRVYLVGLPDRMAQAEDLFSHRKQARRVCIIGGGVIGQSLSRQLVESGTEVLLIEQDEERAQHLASHLAGVTVVHGDGTDASLLEEEQIGDYDLLVALTHEDEVNLMAALLAGRAGAVRTGCLVHRPAYTEIYHQLGIDVVLSPRVVASDHIMRYCRQQQVQSLTVIEDGQAEVLELRAPERCRLIGVPVRRLAWPRGALLAAIVKGDSVMVPHGDDVVEAGDVVVVLTTTAARPAVLRLFKERAL